MSGSTRTRRIAGSAIFALILVASGLMSTTPAYAKNLTLCWAAWDPAEPSQEFTFTQSSGPGGQRLLNELNSKSKLCDLIVGDSQEIDTTFTAPGVDMAAGAVMFTATSTEQEFTEPMTSLGSIVDGDVAQYTFTDIETFGGIPVAIITVTGEVICHTSDGLTGTCRTP